MRPREDNLELTELVPRFAPDGTLALGLQFTAPTCYACTRGGWSSYTKSTIVDTPRDAEHARSLRQPAAGGARVFARAPGRRGEGVERALTKAPCLGFHLTAITRRQRGRIARATFCQMMHAIRASLLLLLLHGIAACGGAIAPEDGGAPGSDNDDAGTGGAAPAGVIQAALTRALSIATTPPATNSRARRLDLVPKPRGPRKWTR